MRHPAPSENRRRERAIPVDWRDCAWQPQVIVRRPAANIFFKPPSRLDFPRRNFILSKTMKTILPQSRRHRAGFTLIELLVVISIIAILAAMLLPVLHSAVEATKKAKAKTEEQGILTAITHYDSVYGRLPTAQTPGTSDFTYGGSLLAKYLGAGNWTNDNSEVMAILMNITNTSVTSVNANSQKNPQQTVFLTPKMVNDTSSPGVGTDLVYRDPWGNPYVISMDLSYNEMCVDAFYGNHVVSGGGLNGLVQDSSVSSTDNWASRGKVMVWSAGSDGKIDSGTPANQGVNKDNVLSWQ
jgi:prepilin-type N-terminal cleavage/methylation domain-containing protein